MPMTIRPPVNASSARRSSSAASARVEVMGLGVEVLDRLGHDPRPGREDEVVVAESLAVRELDGLRRLVDLLDLADHEADPLVEQAALGALELLGPLAAHGDVHEPRLVGVLAGLVDDGDRHLAGLDLAAQLLDQQVRGQRAADAAAEDEDPLHHGPQWVFSTTISS